MNLSAQFEVQSWGRIPYKEAWEKQKILLERRISDDIGDQLIFCEHDPIITLGRGSQRDGVQSYPKLPFGTSIEVLEVERGGLATYHGPGQLVVYPIFKLGRSQVEAPHSSRRGVLGLIRSLEGWVVDYLDKFGLNAGTVESKTGVWISGERKISSIGIAARHWVSYHGLSLNLSTGKDPWRLLSPCGFSPDVMTDLQAESSQKISYADAVTQLSELAIVHF